MSNLGISALTTTALTALRTQTTQRAWIKDSGTQHTMIQVDASISEKHSIVSTPSKFPIENGTNITDNFMVEPAELEMTGIISDDPISAVNSLVTSTLSTVLPASGIVAGGAAIAVFNAINGLSAGAGFQPKPSIANFNSFVQIVVNKNPVDVFTTLKLYKNMWLSSLSVDRDASLGNALMFKAHFVQVILVRPQVVNLGQFSNPGISSGQANLGKEQTAESAIANAGFTNGRTTGITVENKTIGALLPK